MYLVGKRDVFVRALETGRKARLAEFSPVSQRELIHFLFMTMYIYCLQFTPGI